MHSRHLSSTLSFLVLVVLVSPYPSVPLHSRQDDSSSGPPTAGFLTTVKSSTGADITSSFQTLFFDGTAIETLSNLTERQVFSASRPINYCLHNGPGDFQYSKCVPLTNTGTHSLQRFMVRCKIPNPQSSGGRRSYTFPVQKVSFASLPKTSSLLERLRRFLRPVAYTSFFWYLLTNRRTYCKRVFVMRTKSA